MHCDAGAFGKLGDSRLDELGCRCEPGSLTLDGTELTNRGRSPETSSGLGDGDGFRGGDGDGFSDENGLCDSDGDGPSDEDGLCDGGYGPGDGDGLCDSDGDGVSDEDRL